MSQSDTAQRRTAAPYVSYPTIKTFLAPLKEHVIPNRIDKSLLKSMSGAVQSQLMTALKFLALIEDDGRPTEALKKLVAAYDTDQWPSELQFVLVNAYEELFQLPLETVSPSQFNEAFKGAYPCEGDTLSKGVRFFLTAASDAGVKFSPFLLKNAKPRVTSSGKRRARPSRNGNTHREDTPPPTNSDIDDHHRPKTTIFQQELLNKFPAFDPEWPDEIKAKWFAGFEQFMAMTKK